MNDVFPRPFDRLAAAGARPRGLVDRYDVRPQRQLVPRPRPGLKGPMALTAELVAHCERPEPDPGPDPSRRYFTEAEYEAAAARLIEQSAPGPLWVFAYGSLIWKPAIATTEHRRAVAHGWHRAFCLKLSVPQFSQTDADAGGFCSNRARRRLIQTAAALMQTIPSHYGPGLWISRS